MDYSQLAPGLYIQQGESIKALDVSLARMLGGGIPDSDIETYAAQVSWVFIALNKRRNLMRELLPLGSWMQGENELETFPFAFNWTRECVRVDQALQTTQQGYLFKQRRGRLLVGIRWLDPDAVEPDAKSLEIIPGGVRYGRYLYTDNSGQRQTIDASDMIHFMLPGRNDGIPDTSAGVATRLAGNILYNIDLTVSSFFGNNALSVMLVEVPMGTSDTDRDRMESRFSRLFNPKWRQHKDGRTIAVREGVKITPLTINPKEWESDTTTERQIKAVALAHDVPYEELIGDSNYATAVDTRRGWVAVMGQRIEEISTVLAADPDFRALGYTYEPRINEHWSMRRDEVEAAGAILTYVNAGYTVWAASHLLGIDEKRFPQDIIAKGIYRETVEPGASANEVTGSTTEGGDFAASNTGYNPPGDEFDVKSALWLDEARRFKRWVKKRPDADIVAFKSEILSEADKAEILYGDTSAETAYWSSLTAVNEAVRVVIDGQAAAVGV